MKNIHGEDFNPEIHVNKLQLAGTSGQFSSNEILKVTGGKVITDCSLLLEGFDPVTEQPCTICQKWGLMFRRRLPVEINPKPQPSFRELETLYGYVGNVSDTDNWTPESVKSSFYFSLDS